MTVMVIPRAETWGGQGLGVGASRLLAPPPGQRHTPHESSCSNVFFFCGPLPLTAVGWMGGACACRAFGLRLGPRPDASCSGPRAGQCEALWSSN